MQSMLPRPTDFIASMRCYVSQHKKAVLCEKAFALNSFDAKVMIEAARKNQVFIMEAFWTKFLPQYEKVISLIQVR